MATFNANVQSLATDIGSELKSTRTQINGNAVDLAALNTTAKTNLVAAINEVVASIGSAGASINDTGTSTSSVWSSSKTDNEIGSQLAALVGSAPTALDTLEEFATALGNDANFSTTITNSLAGKAPIASPTFTGTVSGVTKTHVGLPNVDNTSDADKPVSTAQQTALNLKVNAADIGATDTDFVAIFQAALA